ncbi:MAG: GFA family protein [Candidatus Udaeobacter sp.]
MDAILYAKLTVTRMEKKKITGGCYCGEVRFSAAPEVRVRTNCHCANCRRAAGAQAVAWIVVRRSQFQFVKGTPRRYQTETGAWRTFCDRCGTSLTYEHDKRLDEIDVTTGSLDHPEDFPPTKDVYPEERLPWVDLIHH